MFPATLSYRSGLSNHLIAQLHVWNQRKMGPHGVHSLLCEMHTLQFNTLQVQYFEAAFELVQGWQVEDRCCSESDNEVLSI